MASEKFEDYCGLLLIAIDGPISAGKTTLGTELMKRSPEVVHFYRETGHEDNIVDIFLRDPKKNALGFQMLMHGLCYSRHEVAIGKLDEMRHKGVKRYVCIIDRSLMGNMVFGITNHRLGNIDADGYAMYKRQNEQMRTALRKTADVNVYLWVEPNTCTRRNFLRNSQGDELATLEYEKYDTSYYWDVEKSAFAALLSSLTTGIGNKPLIINWHDAYSRDIQNFDRIVREYLASRDKQPIDITLSHDMPLMVDESKPYTHAFDYSELTSVHEFYSREVITEVMNAIAYTTTYDGARNIHMRLPTCVESESFSDLFTLTIH